MKKIVFVFLCVIMALETIGCGKEKKIEGNKTNTPVSSENREEKEITWDEITKEGVNESLFLENLDTKLLEEIASNLQSAIEEETKDEMENPEIVLTEGWVRIFKKEQYKKVIAMGKPAMKPLYWILYKSKNNGQYEYLCAKALQEISGITFEDKEKGTMGWSTASEYFTLFTEEIIKRKKV